ncbi:DNA polymerase-3 subunit gamma/tau [Eubacterium uniforme]|uniref:DNA-directed DNA polymerase n=2 Tax=Eubacterium uniforme TaxID=39495 RepID=A0A1T4VI21_9FIRM|nr:DNA polymerase-3 subunit gamma/tau [Eubacterium uniforme]
MTMAYLSLYRKFRPQTFADVKGQDHIVTTLQNQIKSGRFAHAYLFTGTRGTGKTSVAKILARAVNCQNPVDGSPCGECERCKAALDGSSINIIEMDAASNNGVDNIRQINEEVRYAPTDDKYKVYIIDEVHMLSTGAFNALLKTLEEPPEYVIFILATTEVHKIPITIMSRCQRYDFKHISLDVIYNRLKELMDAEGINAEEKALRYIAKAADGSMRDALSLLDRCIAFYLGEDLTYENVLEVLGAVDTEVFERLLCAIVDEDVSGSLNVIEEMVQAGRDLSQFTSDFIWYMRNLLLVKVSDNMSSIVDMSDEKLSQMANDAKLFDEAIIMRYIKVLSETLASMKFQSSKRVLLEIAIIKIIKPSMEKDVTSLLNRIENMEKKLERGEYVATSGEKPAGGSEESNDAEKEEKLKGKLEMPVPEDLQYIVDNWQKVTASKNITGLHRVLIDKTKKYFDKNGTLVLAIKEGSTSYDMLANAGEDKILEEALAKNTGKEIHVSIIMETDVYNKSEDYGSINPFNIDLEEED